MSGNSYDDELARRREIERKLKNMSYEEEVARSAKSSASQSRYSYSGNGSGRRNYSDAKVRQVSEEEIIRADQRKRGSSQPVKNTSQRPPQKKKKKKKRGLKVLIGILIAIVLIIAVAFGAVKSMLSDLERTELTGDVDAAEGVSYIKNIALFGIDTRDSDSESGRSDAIMIMSVNKKTGEINLISILRDSTVTIEGYGETKINAAYSYGGATLAVKTLNQNFNLDITDYVTVNFAQLATIINAVGGVTLEITAEEAEYINAYLNDSANNDMLVEELEYVEVADQTVLLNGDQAVAYSRIRYVDSDAGRASRQQKVLTAMLSNIKEMSITKYPALIKEFMSVSESSLTDSEIMSFAPLVFKNFTITTYTVPDYDYETDLTSGYNSSGQWCWFYDLDAAAQRIHSIIYGE